MLRGYEVAFENVSYVVGSTGGRNRILVNELTFNISRSQFVAIVGENGAGKSTVVSLLSGEHVASSGDVIIGGCRVDRPISQLIDGVGIVHQDDKEDFVGDLSIARNLYLRQVFGKKGVSTWRGVTNAWKRDIRTRLQEYTDVRYDLDLLVETLSGGERQILNLLSAMQFEHADNPCKLLLLDEHTSRLDHARSEILMDITKRNVIDAECTAVMVTHRYADALKYCDRIIILKKGSLTHDMVRSEFPTLDQLSLMVVGGASVRAGVA